MAENRSQLIERMKAGQNTHELARADIGLADDTTITRFRWGGGLQHADPLGHLTYTPSSAQVLTYNGNQKTPWNVRVENLDILAAPVLRNLAETTDRDVTTLPLYQVVQGSEVEEYLRPYVLAQQERTKDIIRRTQYLEEFIEAKGFFVAENAIGRTVDCYRYAHLNPETMEEDIFDLLLLSGGTSYAASGALLDTATRGKFGQLSGQYLGAHQVKEAGDLPVNNYAWKSPEWEAYKASTVKVSADPLTRIEALPSLSEQEDLLRVLGPIVGGLPGTLRRCEEVRGTDLPAEVTLCEVIVWVLAHISDTEKVAPVVRGFHGKLRGLTMLCCPKDQVHQMIDVLKVSDGGGPTATFTLVA